MPLNLRDLLPPIEEADSDELLNRFLEYVESRGLELYPAQEAAILEVFEESNVILNTPTGSGKSLVASALHFKSLAQGQRSVYTCPIKALVNEKWMALCRDFGPENVGLSTGDATVNRDAPILCCTAEILANLALRDGENSDIQDVVADEFHYYADHERGVAWQVPLLTLRRTRFLLMSATLGETKFFEDELTSLNGRRSVTVRSIERPVPLEFSYAETPLAQTLQKLTEEGKGPLYVVHFTQREAAESAQDFMSIDVSSRDEKKAIQKEIEDFRFTSPYGPQLKRWARHGIGLHHAGLLPKYRVLIERLAQKNLLKVICGTDTLGVGINVPIRTVLFTKLCKFDGQKTRILSARDFHQISGRAGRKGFDDVGWVVAQAPEHVIENLKLASKAARDGKKKFVKRKPPTKNFVHWDEKTLDKLIKSSPEQLQSRFQVSHGMILNVLSRRGNSCEAMRELIHRSHESDQRKRTHGRRAWRIFRSLLDQEVIKLIPPENDGTYLQVNVELQEDFSMDQSLSLYLIETLPKLDMESPEYPLDVLTLIESVLEDPGVILYKQLDRIKGEAVARMKMEGLEYEERMLELEKLDYPKPNREFIESTFHEFTRRHPWLAREDVLPKSIARDMFEQYSSFSDYVRGYELQRSEGLLLRHLSSVHKVLRRTIPDSAKSDELWEVEVYLESMIRQVDSSLIDEWEKMRDAGYEPEEDDELRPPGADAAEADFTRDEKAFLAATRNRIFSFLRALIVDDLEDALAQLEEGVDIDGNPWTVDRLGQALDEYFADHEAICLDPNARNIRHTHKTHSDDASWVIQQVLVDPEEHCDWMAEFEVLLAPSRERRDAVLEFRRIGT